MTSQTAPKNNRYDVVIPGGGLAGLTLSIQIKKANPEISVLVLERRDDSAATAAHKVGESTVELGTHYIREVLNLKGYLEEKELPKHGLRFFFRTKDKKDIESRVELGPRERLPVPSHQLDRGTFENYLAKHAQELGVEFILGGRVKDVTLNKEEEEHDLSFILDEVEYRVKSKWIADATGRGSLLKRKLGFAETVDHDINAVWFRLKGKIDVDKWSTDKEWLKALNPDLRWLSTIHFMDKGYWLWIIPLGSGNTSIGIVSDPRVHAFETLNTYEKASEWMEKNEPFCAQHLGNGNYELLDFKVLKHFTHGSGRLYSSDRWGVTGEAGVFLDPFYSPGTDFISMSNTLLSDLIVRDVRGEEIGLRSEIYEKTMLTLFQNWVPVYKDKYMLMGKTQIMVVKIFWDWATYWSVPCLLFTNNALTDLQLLKTFFSKSDSLGRKFGALNKSVQDLFVEWGNYDDQIFENKYIDPFDLVFLQDFQKGLDVMHERNELVAKVQENMHRLEQVAVAIFRLVSAQVKGTSYELRVNPYMLSLDNYQEPAEGIEPSADVLKDVDTMWFYEKKMVNL
jgi:flavin-dependent dehydrogenase